MKRTVLLLLILSLALSFGYGYHPERLIIKADQSVIQSIAENFNAEIINEILGFYVLKIPTLKAKLEDISIDIKNMPGLLYVDYDYVKKTQYVPNDQYYGYQWNLQKIGFEKYTDITDSNTSIIVAIADTGIDLSHPDLLQNLVTGRNFVSDYDPNDPDDDHFHGTHCAGIVAAVTNNSIGIAGVAPKAKLMPIKVLDGNGDGYDSEIAQGIKWAADNGAHIISLSLGGSEAGNVLKEACDYAYGRGVIVIAASGNDNWDRLLYPARYDSVIAVGASNKRDARSSYSNYGTGIDLIAPGDSIYSTIPTFYTQNYYHLSGTSMACPHVSGAAALVYSLGITSPDAVKRLLTMTAKDIGEPGYDLETGWGRLDIYNALMTHTKDIDKGIKTAYGYPNPFYKDFNVIYTPKKTGTLKYRVFTEFMEEIYSEEFNVTQYENFSFNICLKDYKRGIYIVLMQSSEGKKIIKMVKE